MANGLLGDIGGAIGSPFVSTNLERTAAHEAAIRRESEAATKQIIRDLRATGASDADIAETLNIDPAFIASVEGVSNLDNTADIANAAARFAEIGTFDPSLVEGVADLVRQEMSEREGRRFDAGAIVSTPNVITSLRTTQRG